MNRLTPEIEKAYRNWRRTLIEDDAPVPKPARAQGKRRRSPESREKSRQAALKRWAKKRAA